MEEYLEIIKRCILFKGFKEAEIIDFLTKVSAKLSEFKKDEFIIKTNDKPNEFGILIKGSANIQKLDFNGKLNITSNIDVSELFGEAFVYADINKALVSVCCNENSSVILLNKNNISNLAHSDIELFKKFNENMLKCMSKKLVNLNRKIDILTGQNIREKILGYLDSLSEDNKKSTIEIPFNREQLADFLCVNRSSLSRELSKMRDEGIIDFYKNSFKKL